MILLLRLVFVHYQNGSAGMSLYLMNGNGLDVPDQPLTRAGARQVSTHVVNGLTTALWQADGLVYVAVSDTTGADLLDFVAAI